MLSFSYIKEKRSTQVRGNTYEVKLAWNKKATRNWGDFWKRDKIKSENDG